MSGGGGSGDTIIQENQVSPYEPSEQYLKNILSEASNLYQSGAGSQYYPGSTVVPFASQTQAGLQGLENLSRNQLSGSPMMQQAGNVFSGFAAGQAPSVFGGNVGAGGQYSGIPTQTYSGMAQLSPQQAYLGDVRSAITSDVMGDVQSQFGGMGRTGSSPAAQAAAARGVAQAYAPIATQVSEAERNRQLGMQQDALSRAQSANQFQTQSMMGMQGDQFRRQQAADMMNAQQMQAANQYGQQQQLMAAGQLPGMQQAADARAMAGAQGLAGVGGAFEDLQGRFLQEDLQRYQYEQMSPYNRLAQYAGIVSPIASGFPITQQAAEQPRYNALTGALGGGLAAGSIFGGNPYFAAGGALLGGLGGFF
tara:strand:+ start:491 stop:1585 length:1095 start_codon:yes stop_codon:yes gene_type:complete